MTRTELTASDQKHRWRWLAAYLLLSTFLVCAFTTWGTEAEDRGYPLDDAWIHQHYARSLIETGRWEYNPGVVSAGSTAPAWTVLLSIGYLARIPHLWWTWALGTLMLALTGFLARRLSVRMFGASSPAASLVGLLVLAEWHLVWAASSGMEILLLCLLVLAIFDLALTILERGADASVWLWLWIGGLGSIAVLTRPEGILVSIMVGIWLTISSVRNGWLSVLLRRALVAIAVGLLFLIPNIAFNLRHGFGLWPNTYYAKQAEYGLLLATPLLWRISELSKPILAGSVVIALPTAIACLILSMRGPRNISRLEKDGIVSASNRMSKSFVWVMIAYALAHILLYMFRLPVNYQHGRYLMPVIPAILVVGLGFGAANLDMKHPNLINRVIATTWFGIVVVLTVSFLVIGRSAYVDDVTIIQNEMVETANWVDANVPSNASIAAHDIGALAYFSQRELIDLAGLISPEIVPLLSDDAKLHQFILESDARYLVTAPGWQYSEITDSSKSMLLHRSDTPEELLINLNRTSVYLLDK